MEPSHSVKGSIDSYVRGAGSEIPPFVHILPNLTLSQLNSPASTNKTPILKTPASTDSNNTRLHLRKSIIQTLYQRQEKPPLTNEIISKCLQALLQNRWNLKTRVDLGIGEKKDQSKDPKRIPLYFGHRFFGNVYLLSQPGETAEINHQISFLKIFAREVSFVLNRHHCRQQILVNKKPQTPLVGQSTAQWKTENFIDKVARVNLPVLLRGEFGTEKLHVASSIHYSSQHSSQVFSEINCISIGNDLPISSMEECFCRTEGGTLFFNGMDHLSLQQQKEIIKLIDKHRLRSNLRLIGATTQNLHSLVNEGIFLKELLIKFDILSFYITPLRERREDIPEWIEFFRQKYQLTPNQGFDESVIRLLENYSWPNNLVELERTVARLLTLSANQSVSLNEVIEFTPEIAQASQHIVEDLRENKLSGSTKNLKIINLAKNLANKNCEELDRYHPSLARIFKFISENYTEDIDLRKLTKVAHISVSYLYYLFRKELGIPFKIFLGKVRIEKAKQLLIENYKLRITDIAFEVGYCDLSYFQRVFKRNVGITPGNYRKQHKLRLREEM